ncbi:MAG: TonB-dependent receptor [Acidobacteria bacterium]|nr:TonB-dependent receptor [Acidobacteriota bacterium]
MTMRKSIGAIVVLVAGAACGFGQEVRGRVTDAQGAALANVAVTIEGNGSPPRSAQTGQDGGYSLVGLPPSRYMIRAQKAGFAEQRQGPLELAASGAALVVNFRLAPAAETEAVRGAEERNPNDFVIRLDTNSITNELARTGGNLRYLTEFRADRNYYGEPFGFPLRSVETASLGSVLGSYHGSISEFHQDSALNARPFFQVGSLLPSRRNQYAFSVSGPIVKERLSFNFAWGQVRDSGFVNGNVQVPLAEERTPSATDPEQYAIIAAMLKAFPDELPNLPHVSKRHLNTNSFRNIRNTAFSIHVDSRFASGDRLAFEQQFSDGTEDPFELVLGQNPQTTTKPQSLRLTYSRIVSPRTVMQLYAIYDRLTAVLLPTKRYQNLLSSLGIQQVPDFDLGEELTNIGIPSQGIPRKRYENHYLLGGQFTRTAGRHNFSTGGSGKLLWDSDERRSHGRGTLLFNRDFTIFDPELENPDGTRGRERTATAVENFLRGQASRLSLAVGNQYRGYRNWEWIAYFQERFTVRPGLQFNLGLRYEALTVPHEVNDLFEFQHDTDANNFAPQFGFAWSPPATGVVVRGGYGIAFGSMTIATWNRQASNPPMTQSLSVDKPTVAIIPEIPSRQPDPTRKSTVGSFDSEAALPYTHTYNFSLERELQTAILLRAGYQGSRTYKMFTGLALNRARYDPLCLDSPSRDCNSSADVNARRPDQRFLRIYNIVSGSNGYHDGLQVSVVKKRTRGLSFELRYAFSKSIDSGIFNFADAGNGGEVSQTEELIGDVKSVSAFDTPHSFSINYSYELPRLPTGPEWLANFFQRWTVSGTTIFRSGTPFAVFTGSDGPGSGNVDGEPNDRPNLLNPEILGRSFDDPDTSAQWMGALRHDCTEVLVPGSATDSYKQCKYFDTNLPVGGRGNLGYRVFRKDGTNNWNLALARSFPLPGASSEKQLQFRAEFYNFLNHAQFAAPGYSISSPTFGQITNTVNKGRVTQLSLRLIF